MSIEFKRTNETVSFHSPLADMKLITGDIERRQDPLTGKIAVLSSFLKDKAVILFPDTDHELLKKLVDQTKPKCFFCPERVASVTPRFPKDWIPDGKIARGECLLFPNLFPLSAVHGVIAVGHEHHRHLDEFPAELIADGFGAASDFIQTVHPKEPALNCYTLNGNYLFPGGASIVHPHFQLLGSRHPAGAVTELTAACINFKRNHGTNYFDTLLDIEEQQNQRFIGTIGKTKWLVPFAPTGLNEVLGILPHVSTLLELTPEAIQDLAAGFSKILSGYHSLGCSTFNFSIYSPPLNSPAPAFPVFLRVMCRQNVYANHRTDDYFVQKLLSEEILISPPEALANTLKKFF